MPRIDNETIERAVKLLDSGYYTRGVVSKMLSIPLVDVDRIRSGALCPEIDISDYRRCPKCGYLVRMPCVSCLAKSKQPIMVLAVDRSDFMMWVGENGFDCRVYRYVGGVYHLLSFKRGIEMVRLPGWYGNTYYDKIFRDELCIRKFVDITGKYRDTFYDL